MVGQLPATGETVLEGSLAERAVLLRWPGAAASVNFKLPVARLRRLVTSIAA
jgi:hypothetical protein